MPIPVPLAAGLHGSARATASLLIVDLWDPHAGSVQQQRQLARAIKTARETALLPCSFRGRASS